MDHLELMDIFIERFVVSDKQSKWRDLSKRKLAIYKKIAQLGGSSLNAKCRHEHGSPQLDAFVARHKAVWLWDFLPDPPVLLKAAPDAAAVNQRAAYLAIADASKEALYFNGDEDFWICVA